MNLKQKTQDCIYLSSYIDPRAFSISQTTCNDKRDKKQNSDLVLILNFIF